MAHTDICKTTLASIYNRCYGLRWINGAGGGISMWNENRTVFYYIPSDNYIKYKVDNTMVEDTEIGAPLIKDMCAPVIGFTFENYYVTFHTHSVNSKIIAERGEMFECSGHREIQTLFNRETGRFFGFGERLKIPIINDCPNEELETNIKDAANKGNVNAVLVKKHGFFMWSSQKIDCAFKECEAFEFLFEFAARNGNI